MENLLLVLMEMTSVDRHNFDTLSSTGYTLATLARYTGLKNQRVISSRTRNFFFGFHGSQVGKWYAEDGFQRPAS